MHHRAMMGNTCHAAATKILSADRKVWFTKNRKGRGGRRPSRMIAAPRRPRSHTDNTTSVSQEECRQTHIRHLRRQAPAAKTMLQVPVCRHCLPRRENRPLFRTPLVLIVSTHEKRISHRHDSGRQSPTPPFRCEPSGRSTDRTRQTGSYRHSSASARQCPQEAG